MPPHSNENDNERSGVWCTGSLGVEHDDVGKGIEASWRDPGSGNYLTNRLTAFGTTEHNDAIKIRSKRLLDAGGVKVWARLMR
jgi:hypothetical protein